MPIIYLHINFGIQIHLINIHFAHKFLMYICLICMLNSMLVLAEYISERYRNMKGVLY